MSPVQPSAPFLTQGFTGDDVEIAGRELRDTLVDFLEEHCRGRLRTDAACAVDGRYRVRTVPTAKLLCHMLQAIDEHAAIDAVLRADSYTMQLALHVTETGLTARARRALLLEAHELRLDLSIEPQVLVLKFPACEETFALRHPFSSSPEASLASHLRACWDATSKDRKAQGLC